MKQSSLVQRFAMRRSLACLVLMISTCTLTALAFTVSPPLHAAVDHLPASVRMSAEPEQCEIITLEQYSDDGGKGVEA